MTAFGQTVSVSNLKHAIEGRDAKALTSLYADEALLRVIDHDNPPSRPRDIRGKQAIAAYYNDVCSRTMSHSVHSTVSSSGSLSFMQTCTYPDGAKALCATMLELKDGKIIRQTAVQAWDS